MTTTTTTNAARYYFHRRLPLTLTFSLFFIPRKLLLWFWARTRLPSYNFILRMCICMLFIFPGSLRNTQATATVCAPLAKSGERTPAENAIYSLHSSRKTQHKKTFSFSLSLRSFCVPGLVLHETPWQQFSLCVCTLLLELHVVSWLYWRTSGHLILFYLVVSTNYIYPACTRSSSSPPVCPFFLNMDEGEREERGEIS